MSELEERMTVATVDICSCGIVMHQLDGDDYDTLGSDSGMCCPDCGNEQFATIEQLQAELAAEQEKNRWIPVSEMLPEKVHRTKTLFFNCSDDVIVSDGNSWCSGRYKFLSESWGRSDHNVGEVTHWRHIHLPEEDEVKP